MEFRDAMDSMVKNFEDMMLQMIAKAEYDKSYVGLIVDHKTNSDSTIYSVLINGETKNIKSNIILEDGEYALVLVPRNRWQDARIISSHTELDWDVVTTF